jgi:hypothetical protein
LEYKDYVQSGAACIQNMILAAYSFDMGCCWVCNLPPKKFLRKIFKIPWNYDPIAMVAMGYYDDKPKNRPRKFSVKEVVSYELFSFKEKKASKNELKLAARRIFRKIYHSLPSSLKKHLNKIAFRFERKFD